MREFFYLFLQMFAFNLAYIYCTLKKVNQKTNPWGKRMYKSGDGFFDHPFLYCII